MKKVSMGIIAMTLFAGAAIFAAPKMGTFTGEIMDSQCALQGGSHDNMIRVGQSEKDCTLSCLKIGGSLVMYDAKTKTTYKLDNQKLAVKFAGEKVKINGDLNEATKTIKVTSMVKGA
jgi:type 1 fimbria pilin